MASMDTNSPYLRNTNLTPQELQAIMAASSGLGAQGYKDSAGIGYTPFYEGRSQGPEGELIPGTLAYIMGTIDNGLYSKWDANNGSFMGYGQPGNDSFWESLTVPAAFAALAMGGGALANAVGGSASAGLGAGSTAGGGAMGAGADYGLGALGAGESAAGGSSIYGLAGSAGAPAAPGMTAGTSGLGMSAGGVSTSGLTSGASGLATLGASGAAGQTGSLLSGLGTLGQAASGGGGLSSLIGNPTDLQSLVALGGGVGGLIDSQNKQDAINNNTNNFMSRWDNFYAPGSDEYNLLKQEMERKDAAAGRNSQYGTRLAEMGGRIAQAKFNSLSSMYNTANQGVNSANSVGSGLGQLFGGIGTAAQNGTLGKIFGGTT